MDSRKQTGQQGETLAVAYLVKRGYKIIDCNWRCPTGELDIIARHEQTLVFIEVRTRTGQRFGLAVESITPAKQARLIDLAQSYIQEMAMVNQAWRIDVIAVQLRGNQSYINHIENAIGW